jgi:NAD(P)-dependent dehydrogenase (short-subunit alcohol dehydrogenase family)
MNGSEEVPAELHDQVAVVTGGGRGIGRNVALELAAAGAKVVVAARSADEIRETAEEIGAASARPADVGEERDHRKKRAARDLRRRVHLEEALERPGRRPRDRGDDHGDVPPAAAWVGVRGRHRSTLLGGKR